MEHKKRFMIVFFTCFFALALVFAAFLFERVVYQCVSESSSMRFESRSQNGLGIRTVSAAAVQDDIIGPSMILEGGASPVSFVPYLSESLPGTPFDDFELSREFPYEDFAFLKVTYKDGSEIDPSAEVQWQIRAENCDLPILSGRAESEIVYESADWLQYANDRFPYGMDGDFSEIFLSLHKVVGHPEYAHIGCKIPFFFPVTVTVTVDGESAECSVKYRRSSSLPSLVELGFSGTFETLSVPYRLETADDGTQYFPLRVPLYSKYLISQDESDLYSRRFRGAFYLPLETFDYTSVYHEFSEFVFDGDLGIPNVSFADCDVCRYGSGLRYAAWLGSADNDFDSVISRDFDPYSSPEIGGFLNEVVGRGHGISFMSVDDFSEEALAVYGIASSELSDVFFSGGASVKLTDTFQTLYGVSPYEAWGEPTEDGYYSALSGSFALDDFFFFPGASELSDLSQYTEALVRGAQAYLEDPTAYKWQPTYYLKVLLSDESEIVIGVGPDFSGGPFGYQGIHA